MDRFQPSIESEFIENSVNQYYLKALEEKRIAPVNMGSVSDIDFFSFHKNKPRYQSGLIILVSLYL